MWSHYENKYKSLSVNWATPHLPTDAEKPGNLHCDILARRWILATLTTP